MSYLATKSQPKPYFIGIDSDGTVFDSMEIKHKRVFQPIAIELWGLRSIESVYCSICESINLYSVLRGINRFQGLALAFEHLSEQSDEGRDALEGHHSLQEFVRSSGSHSYAALAEYNDSKGSAFLGQALEWSRRSDALYAEIMESEGSPSFPRIHGILERASKKCEVVVVSSSSRATLMQDWGKAGLLPFVTRVEGQEQGSKSKQLESALNNGRTACQALMIGDALSDLEAAREHGILFYPITPGSEARSWERFEAEALGRFYSGSYGGEYEQTLLSDFKNVLQPDDGSCVSLSL